MDGFDDYMFNVIIPDIEDKEREENEKNTYYREHGSFEGYASRGGGSCCLVFLIPILLMTLIFHSCS